MYQIKVELLQTMGSDREIAISAWTSSTDHQKKRNKTDEDVKRVVNMLADSGHSTPFESIVFKFWLKLPIFIDRQLMTHRLQSSSGMSARYRSMPNEFLELPEDVLTIYNKININEGLLTEARYERLCKEANSFYRQELLSLKEEEKKGTISNVEYKRIREVLRGVLPLSNMTERVSIMNLRSWANFYKLRSKTDAQPEIQQVAILMLEEIKKANICPIAIEALERNNWQI